MKRVLINQVSSYVAGSIFDTVSTRASVFTNLIADGAIFVDLPNAKLEFIVKLANEYRRSGNNSAADELMRTAYYYLQPIPSVTVVSASLPLVSSGGTTPNISLNDSSVTPGFYKMANIAVDNKGIIQYAELGFPSVYENYVYKGAQSTSTDRWENLIGFEMNVNKDSGSIYCHFDVSCFVLRTETLCSFRITIGEEEIEGAWGSFKTSMDEQRISVSCSKKIKKLATGQHSLMLQWRTNRDYLQIESSDGDNQVATLSAYEVDVEPLTRVNQT